MSSGRRPVSRPRTGLPLTVAFIDPAHPITADYRGHSRTDECSLPFSQTIFQPPRLQLDTQEAEESITVPNRPSRHNAVHLSYDPNAESLLYQRFASLLRE